MKYCDWCKRAVANLNEVENNGSTSKICDSCKSKLDDGICRVCGQPIGMNAIDGKCLVCIQMDYNESMRKHEEMCLGVDDELQALYGSPLELTDEDYERWMTTSITGVSAESRKKFRLSWLVSTFDGKFGWTPELLQLRYNAIEKILDRNFSKIIGKRLSLIDLSIAKVKIVTCIDREDTVVLVDSTK